MPFSAVMNLAGLVDAVVSLAREVTHREIMPRFENIDYAKKSDGSLLTEADVATQAALVAGLQKILPCPVLGEEMTSEAQEALWASGHEAIWVVDPIDGTTNFIHGIPYFATSIALMRHGRSVLGVIYIPLLDECYHATLGGGAQCNGVPLVRKQRVPKMGDTVAGVEIKWLAGHLPVRLMTTAPYGSHRNFGASTVDWCMLAAGRMDLYLHGGQRLWDYAAGCLIFTEAGGSIATLNQDDYWTDALWSRSVIAALDTQLFAEWKKWVRDNR